MHELDKWETQFRKGMIEAFVLQSLHHLKNIHGYQLLIFMKSQGIETSEGTLYPLLNRLEKNQWLTSSWDIPQEGGHPKRLYALSALGEELLPLISEKIEHYQIIAQKLEKYNG